MGYQPRVYEDADQAIEMRLDCTAVVARMSIADRVVAPAPSILFEHNDREVPKRDIPVSEAARRLASALHLHLD